jgi:hypothetical protein
MLNIFIYMQNKIIKSILPTVFAIMVFAILGNSIQNTVLAQSNSNDTSGNQTRAEITGGPETTIINKTTIPAQQTTVTVNETTSSIDQSALQPLQNQTLGDVPVDLSGIENKTVLQPTGEAQTTMLNKTTVPFEQTTVEGINQTEGQQQVQGNQTATQQGQSGQQQGQSGQQQGQSGQQQGQSGQQQGQSGQQQGQSGQQQGNQSSGPLEQLGEAIKAPFQ